MKVFYIPLLANDAELAITSLTFLLSQQNRTLFMYMYCTQKLTGVKLLILISPDIKLARVLCALVWYGLRIKIMHYATVYEWQCLELIL